MRVAAIVFFMLAAFSFLQNLASSHVPESREQASAQAVGHLIFQGLLVTVGVVLWIMGRKRPRRRYGEILEPEIVEAEIVDEQNPPLA